LVFGEDRVRPFNASAVRMRAMKAWKAAELAPLACDVDAQRREAGTPTAPRSSPPGSPPPPSAATRAGHASVSFTLARYVKALAGTEASDVARVEALLAAAES
jgi:hypothetical protein